MKKKLSNKILSEKKIINNFFKRLNFNKTGTFNFENDAGYLNISEKYKTVVTTDTIVENIDFFSKDPPESIAQKIVCVNLSDLYAMGSLPKAYTLNLSINSSVDDKWLKKFTNKLFKLQKKYKIYLLGGDISKSREICLSATFFGKAKLKNILSQNNCIISDDIWITGNLGNSFLGFKLLTKSKIKVKKTEFATFKKKYFYPNPCSFGYIASKYINAAVDISDGFYGDLNKLLNTKVGAKIKISKIPILKKVKRIISENKYLLKLEDIISWGDDYELMFTSSNQNRKHLLLLAKKQNVKLTNIGTIIKNKGIFDDSMRPIKNLQSFDHFS